MKTGGEVWSQSNLGRKVLIIFYKFCFKKKKKKKKVKESLRNRLHPTVLNCIKLELKARLPVKKHFKHKVM